MFWCIREVVWGTPTRLHSCYTLGAPRPCGIAESDNGGQGLEHRPKHRPQKEGCTPVSNWTISEIGVHLGWTRQPRSPDGELRQSCLLFCCDLECLKQGNRPSVGHTMGGHVIVGAGISHKCPRQCACFSPFWTGSVRVQGLMMMMMGSLLLASVPTLSTSLWAPPGLWASYTHTHTHRTFQLWARPPARAPLLALPGPHPVLPCRAALPHPGAHCCAWLPSLWGVLGSWVPFGRWAVCLSVTDRRTDGWVDRRTGWWGICSPCSFHSALTPKV